MNIRVILLYLILASTFSAWAGDCFTLTEMLEMVEMSRTEQDQTLNRRGYKSPSDIHKDGKIFGNTWMSKTNNTNVAVKWEKKKLLRFEFRLADKAECYWKLYGEREKFGFKPHSKTVDEYETTYYNFVNEKYALIYVWWYYDGSDSEDSKRPAAENDGVKYFQVRIEELKYFNQVDLESQTEKPESHIRY